MTLIDWFQHTQCPPFNIYLIIGRFFSLFSHCATLGGRGEREIGIEKKRLRMCVCVCVYIVCEICLLWARFWLSTNIAGRTREKDRTIRRKKERKRECVCVCVYRLGEGEGFAYPYGIYSVREKNITSLLCGRGHPKRGVSKQAPYFFWKEKIVHFTFWLFFLCYYLSIYIYIYVYIHTPYYYYYYPQLY